MSILLRYKISCLRDKLLCFCRVHKWNIKQDKKPIKGTFCIRCGVKAISETSAEYNGRIMKETMIKREADYHG